MIPEIQTTQLENGLQIATDEMSDARSVSLGVYVNTGTRNETESEKGLSHLLEHMAFKGTKLRSAQDIAIQMDEVGGQLNAYTTRETTAYYTKVLPKDVSLSVDILADILQDAVYNEEEIQKEKSVVIQEIGQAFDTPDDYVFDVFQETAFGSGPMGWSILGTTDSVNALSRPAILNYMQKHYHAGNMVISAAGAIQHSEFSDLIAEKFQNLPNKPLSHYEKSHYQGGCHLIAKDHEQCHLVFGFEGIQADSDDFYIMALYSTLLGGGMSSRLFQTIREKHGLVYSIYSFSTSYKDAGIFGVYAGTGPKEVQKLIPLLTDELLLSTHKLEEAELERAKNQLKAILVMARESTNSRSEQLAQNIMIMNRYITLDEMIADIDKVTLPQIMNLAQKILSSKLTLTALGAVNYVEDYAKIQERLKF